MHWYFWISILALSSCGDPESNHTTTRNSSEQRATVEGQNRPTQSEANTNLGKSLSSIDIDAGKWLDVPKGVLAYSLSDWGVIRSSAASKIEQLLWKQASASISSAEQKVTLVAYPRDVITRNRQLLDKLELATSEPEFQRLSRQFSFHPSIMVSTLRGDPQISIKLWNEIHSEEIDDTTRASYLAGIDFDIYQNASKHFNLENTPIPTTSKTTLIRYGKYYTAIAFTQKFSLPDQSTPIMIQSLRLNILTNDRRIRQILLSSIGSITSESKNLVELKHIAGQLIRQHLTSTDESTQD